ncbi:MAG TPA: phosphate ABC transporter substrate-binding protein [Saprospiraceae bacterium]|nr:phosphate ABC transporter substrate-binding protein [Saprospiraceae bacterium]
MNKILFIIFLSLICAACHKNGNAVENIVIKGSDTEVNVALALAETYMEKDPFISIAVTGGGSGTGIAALLSGKTNIANASRPMKTDELRMAELRGMHPLPIIFGVDALAIVVNAKNPVDSLNFAELGRIFRGETGNWAALGGPEMAVSLYGRQSNSGTFLFFREKILGADYAPSLKQMNGTAQIVEAIATDPAGIGYVGIGYIAEKDGQLPPNIKVLKIGKTSGQEAFSPLVPEHILNGQYPIIRPLYQYVNDRPQGRLLDFLLFTIGAEGQAIVRENGYYPITEAQFSENLKLLDWEMAIK